MTSVVERSDEREQLVRVNAPKKFFRGFIPAMRDIWRYRELLSNLVRKELKVKYKDSVLGFFWSFARPLFLLFVYWLIFGVLFKNSMPDFAIYLFAGLLAWELFSVIVTSCTLSVVGNAGLIKKVYFPREVLPLANVGASLVNFAFQLIVLFVVLAIIRYPVWGWNLLLLPLALVTLLVLSAGIGMLLSVWNVQFRDVQHLLELVLVFGFWTTPIIYPVGYVLDRTTEVLGVKVSTLYFLNPLTNIVMSFQRAIYNNTTPLSNAPQPGQAGAFTAQAQDVLYPASLWGYAARLSIVLAIGIVLFWLAQRIFARAEGSFAQEL